MGDARPVVQSVTDRAAAEQAARGIVVEWWPEAGGFWPATPGTPVANDLEKLIQRITAALQGRERIAAAFSHFVEHCTVDTPDLPLLGGHEYCERVCEANHAGAGANLVA